MGRSSVRRGEDTLGVSNAMIYNGERGDSSRHREGGRHRAGGGHQHRYAKNPMRPNAHQCTVTECVRSVVFGMLGDALESRRDWRYVARA